MECSFIIYFVSQLFFFQIFHLLILTIIIYIYSIQKSKRNDAGKKDGNTGKGSKVPPREHRGVRELRLKKQNGPVFWRGQRVK